MRESRLGTRIGIGYALVILPFAAAAAITIWNVDQIERTSNRIHTLRVPTLDAGRGILGALDRSIDALKGWALLGEAPQKDERSRVWSEQIDPALAHLRELAPSWADTGDLARLTRVEDKLQTFRRQQAEIESIAQTTENRPAVQRFDRDATAEAAEMTAALTEIVGIEQNRPKTPQSARRIEALAEFRNEASHGLSSLRAYLLTGDEPSREAHAASWQRNSERLNEFVEKVDTLGPQQRKALAQLEHARARLDRTRNELLSMRTTGEWDLAGHWLRTTADPIASEIKALLGALLANQQRLADEDYLRNAELSRALVVIQWVLFVAGIGLAVPFAFFFTRSVTSRIRSAVAAVEEIASGRLGAELTVTGSYEGRLFESAFARMVTTLRRIADQADAIANGNYAVDVEPCCADDALGVAIRDMTVALREKTAETDRGRKALRAIVDTSIDGMITLDDHGIIQSFNRGAEKMFGHRSKSVVGKSLSVLVPPQSRREYEELMEVYFRAGDLTAVNLDRNFLGQRKNGETFPIRIAVGESRVDSRRLFTGIVRDVTEEERAKDELLKRTDDIENQSWLKSQVARVSGVLQGQRNLTALGDSLMKELPATVSCAAAAFYVADESQASAASVGDDAAQPATRTARRFEFLGGYACGDGRGRPRRFHAGEGLAGQCVVDRKPILLTDVPHGYARIRSALGSARPRTVLVQPILFEERVVGVLELATLHEFSELQRDLIDQLSVSIGVAVASVTSRQRTERLLAESQTMAIEMGLQTEELRATNDELAEKSRALEVKTSEAERLTGEAQAQSEELQASNEELEEKTRALERQKEAIEATNAEIEAARRALEEKAKELEAASRYKSQFLANMSHELRTPLNSLLILAESLSTDGGDNLTADQHESVSIIHSAGKDLLSLINDILDLSKVEAGKMQAEPVEVSVSDIVESLRVQFEKVAEKRGVAFEVDVDETAPERMYTDVQRVEQILRNLLSNAFKFTHQGSVTLRVERATNAVTRKLIGSDDRKLVAFSVQDTGIGISETKQLEIFEAFQQADGSTSREYGGTGLGLTISRQFAQLLGGAIRVTSETGRGSTFTLTIPQELESPESIGAVAPVGDATLNGSHAPHNGSRQPSPVATAATATDPVRDDRDLIHNGEPSLLILEREPRSARTLIELGHRHGYKCLAAADAASAAELATSFKPNALLIDAAAPDADDLMGRLEADPVTARIPVHVISASGSGTPSSAHATFHRLSKPFSAEALEVTFDGIEESINSRVATLLVVEDDAATRHAIAELMKSRDVEVTFATSGSEGLESLKDHDFDCIILDLGLGDMTGNELIARMEEELQPNATPIIVYTARDLTRDEHRDLARRTQGVVVKGSESSTRLLDEVSTFLHRLNGGRSKSARNGAATNGSAPSCDSALEGKHVLLVDDDMRNTFALSRVLIGRGLQVTLADNGEMALRKLEEDSSIDLVLMDIMMPVMDGYEAMRRIRLLNDPRSKVPVIALTANAMSDDRGKCIDAGADEYLTKPVEINRMLSVMRVWLGPEL